MEPQLAQLHIYMIIFMVLCPMELVHSFDHNVEPNAIASLPCSQRYLSKSYFEKHDRLIDPDFEDYLAYKIPLCSCNAIPDNTNYMPKLSILQRRLIGEGSHRHLSTVIKFHSLTDPTLELPAHSCQAVIIEKLPSGVFADPFELQHLVQRGIFADAGVFGDTNLELPSALSNPSVVEIHLDIKGVEINLDLPLHARYPPLDASGYSNVEMGLPDILVRCITTKEEDCSLITRVENGNTSDDGVVWRIPCGNKAHSGLVSALTFISALLFSLLIVLSAICFTPNPYLTSNSKQS